MKTMFLKENRKLEGEKKKGPKQKLNIFSCKQRV